MIKKILIATDGSTIADNAVAEAAILAAGIGAEVTVLTVIQYGLVPQSVLDLARAEHLLESNTVTPPALANVPLWMVDAMKAIGSVQEERLALDRLAERILMRAEGQLADQGVKATTRQERGDPAECIVAVARAMDADLIVLGYRGLGNLGELLLGSVALKVGQLAPCSVLLVR